MTVYKAIKKEADAAAELAIALAKGEEPTVGDDAGQQRDEGRALGPAGPGRRSPRTISRSTSGESDFPKVEEICAGKVAAKCKEIGLQ